MVYIDLFPVLIIFSLKNNPFIVLHVFYKMSLDVCHFLAL